MRFLSGSFSEEDLLPGLRAWQGEDPLLLIDLRTKRDQRIVAWAGDALPVYHAGDVLAELCSWEEAVYPTAVPNWEAVYPPAIGAELPDELPPIPERATLVLLDAEAATLADETDGIRLWWGDNPPAGWTAVTAENWLEDGRAQSFWRRLWSSRKKK